ncbi:MAG: protein phosphatase 2C domain-containing protein [Synergistaceae bacterium]|nr:protein phosphatase 2C domain-containing protein [Synergistaceae bacterium]
MTYIGNSHVRHGMPCQDRAIAVKDKDLVVLAVADGMGCEAYRHVELGAEFAVNYVKEHGKSLMVHAGKATFTKELHRFMYALGSEIVKYAHSMGMYPDDLHTTLSFSLIGPEHFLNVSIGDSPLYTLTKHGPMFLDGNDNGSDREYINRTYSVVDMDYSINYMGVQVGFIKNLRSVLITSDGAIGWSKQEQLLNGENFGDLPAWYYDMLAGKADMKTTVERLAEEGYDDVGIAYYVHDK